MHTTKTKTPRAAASYRGARRNAARVPGGLRTWQAACKMAIAANEKANLGGRAVMANGAREAGAKAVVKARANPNGTPGHILYASAMLEFYCNQKRGRALSRIIRQMQKEVQSHARPVLVA